MQLMKRYTLLMLLFVMAAVMLATSCNKDDDNDDNNPNPTPDPTPVVVEDDFHTVPLTITVGIAPLTGSIDGVETKQAFASGDVIEISNPDVLYEPLTISADGGVGKASANFTAELKVKKGVELVSGTTKLSAVLKNGSNYNNGKPLADVKPIDKPADGLEQYCCWSCEDFTYSSAANAITLAPSTVFVELNMLNDNVIMKIGNADFSETISGSRLYAVPAGTTVEIPNAKFEKLLDGKDQSIYHLTATAPDECLPKLFSIGEDKRVFFSSGNLQYRPLDGAWRLAPQQYHRCFNEDFFDETVGENFSEWMGEDKWTDIFRSGMWIEGGSPNVKDGIPWDFVGMVGEIVEDDDYTFPLDENGEINAPCAYGAQWMVLSIDEWKYLMIKRPDAEQKCGDAVVDGVDGWVVLPDDWTAPEGLTFVPDYEDGFGIESCPNQYTTDEWAAMEAAGAVFLPNAGMIDCTYFMSSTFYPWYQSRTVDDIVRPFYARVKVDNYDILSEHTWGDAFAVRLVQQQSGNTIIKVE